MVGAIALMGGSRQRRASHLGRRHRPRRALATHVSLLRWRWSHEAHTALIAVQRKEAEAAEELYHAIEPQQRTACFIIPFTFDRILGLLAITFGQIDTALAHYEDGLLL